MLKTIKRIIQWCGYRKNRLYKGFVYSFLCTVFTAMPIMGAAKILQMVIEDYQGIKKIDPNWVFYSAVFMCIMVFGRFVMSYLRALNQESISFEITAEDRIQIGEILKRVALGFYEENSIGELTAAITADLSYLEMHSMKMIDNVVNGYIGVIAMVICISFYSIQAALISVIGILLSALALKLMGYFSTKNSNLHLKSQEDIIGATIEYIRGIPIVKAFKQQGASISQIKKSYKDSKNINIRIEKQYAPCNCLHLLALKLSSIGIVGYASVQTVQGNMDIFVMLMLTLFSFVMFGKVEIINNAEHVLSMIKATMDKVEKIKNTKFIDEDGICKKPDNYSIEFKNVSFGYDKRLVLKDISFKIPQNSTTAIIGPSGSGKTTICSLVARFYDISKGSITIGGTDIRELTCENLLNNISMVFQKVYLFNDSILNNIKFGKQDATMEEVIEIAKKARCHDFISALSDGYNTIIGEGGSTLSGGEKQRISIARAMLKDAPIIILDEATASIDPENEYLIQEAIGELVQGKTIITIAHRLATIENADQIIVVDDGRIVQNGNHEKLVNEEGVYKRFMDIRKRSEEWSLGC